MTPVSSPDGLMKIAEAVRFAGGNGILLSGGCDADGTVPLERYVGCISDITGMGMKVNLHAGFITRPEAERLARAGVSSFSMDVHQDPGVISSVLHLGRKPSDYSDLLDALIATKGKVVPHLTVGFGVSDLLMSAELIKDKGLKNVVLLALIPTRGTAVEESILTEDAIVSAVDALMEIGLNVTLGCMRDRRHRELERRCIMSGVRCIANPSSETVRWAESEGFEIKEEKQCCSIVI